MPGLPSAVLIGLMLVLALVLPAVASPFVQSLLTLVFVYAFFGQAWNVVMGYAGQLSLGHGLFVGIGGYTMAVLSLRYGINPWIGIPAGAVASAAIAVLIGALGFRFSVRGVYFALLTIAFAEFARVLFDNWSMVGGTGGMFLPAIPPGTSPLLTLRGGVTFYYYFALALMVSGTALVGMLSLLRFGYVWRAIREDEDAARAIGVRAFRMKILAAAISASMTSVGGSFLALMNGSLFPDTMMGMGMSIQIILAPIVGGLGTVLGAVVGAFVTVPLTHISSHIGQALQLSGLSTLMYGAALFVIVMFLPDGIWPALKGLARRLRPPSPPPRVVGAAAITDGDPP